MRAERFLGGLAVFAIALGSFLAGARAGAEEPRYLSPTALVVSGDGHRLFVACETGKRVLWFDTESRKVVGFVEVPEPASGLALSRDEKRLYVTCAAPESRVCIVEIASSAEAENGSKLKVVGTIPAGHTAMAPVPGSEGRTLYVCNRFNNDVSLLDLTSMSEVERLPTVREPVAAALSLDGRYLWVANHLQNDRADAEHVGAVVSVLDGVSDSAVRQVHLPNGCGVVNDLRISPDGRFVVVSHLVGSFNRAAAQVDQGWMNANALSIMDAATMELRATVLLDGLARGAANPWGVAWSADSATLAVAHSGTHEVSLIDFPVLLAEVQKETQSRHVGSQSPALKGRAGPSRVLTYVSRYEGMDAGFPFLTGARQRIQLPATDLGPRAVAIAGRMVYVANYFSDTLSLIELPEPGQGTNAPAPKVSSVPLGAAPRMDLVRKGELYFHDATLCRQGWQSCASCHPGGGRTDGLNWDLLNDGIGNPKNTKSLLLAFQTPPAMSLGVRETAATAVRAGIRGILFSKQPEEIAQAIDAYIQSLKPVQSPYLVKAGAGTKSEGTGEWEFSEPAKRGAKVFRKAGCADCHPPGLYTDLGQYNVGTRAPCDKPADEFDVPSLVELWRTAPYLHDGSALTVREVITTHNPHDEHGHTSNLSAQEIDDLCAFLLSL